MSACLLAALVVGGAESSTLEVIRDRRATYGVPLHDDPGMPGDDDQADDDGGGGGGGDDSDALYQPDNNNFVDDNSLQDYAE